MKICNLCMHVNHMTVTRCASCRQQDFTPLSESEIRERVPKQQRMKVARRASRNQRSWRRRSFINNKRRDKSFWLKTIATVTAGSMVVTIALNSTIWASPDNPLDIRNFLQSQARIFGLTPLTTELRADVGNLVFVLDGGSDFETSFTTRIYALNKGSTPAELPIEKLCLRTESGHYEALGGPMRGLAEATNPNPPTTVSINPSSEYASDWIFGTGSELILGTWSFRLPVNPLEVYYGECGHPERAWFRFDASVAFQGAQ